MKTKSVSRRRITKMSGGASYDFSQPQPQTKIWNAIPDPISGQMYYYNDQTNEKVWDLPTNNGDCIMINTGRSEQIWCLQDNNGTLQFSSFREDPLVLDAFRQKLAALATLYKTPTPAQNQPTIPVQSIAVTPNEVQAASDPTTSKPQQQQYPTPETSEIYYKQFENEHKKIATKYSFTNTDTTPDLYIENMIGLVLKIDELSNHKNIFYKDNLMINNQAFPVLIRAKETSSTNWKLQTTSKITLGGIYFCGDDTKSEKCIMMDCHLLLNLYKLNANGKELDKTDIKIRKLDDIAKDKYAQTIDNLNAHIQLLKGMKLNMKGYQFTINKNRLKTLSRDTLRNVSETPRSLVYLFDRVSAAAGGNKTRKNTHQKRNVKKNNSRRRRN
jgi:hypothetical protein